MRINGTVRLSQMREISDSRNLLRLSRLASCNTRHVDDPPVFHANLSILRIVQSKADSMTFRCGLGFERQLGDTVIVRVVDQCLLDVVEHLRLVGSVVFDASMPIEVVIGDIGDRGTGEFQGIGEMQLEGAELNAQHIVLGINRRMRHGLADVADGRSGQSARGKHFRGHFRGRGLAVGAGDADPWRRLTRGLTVRS